MSRLLRAEIKGFGSTQVDDLTTWKPDDPSDWSVVVTFAIGVVGEPGADNFDLTITTRDAIAASGRRPDFATFIVERYDWPSVWGLVSAWVAEASGVSWAQISDELGTRMRWENAPPGRR